MQNPGIHHMTALDTGPEEFIELVAAAGSSTVSLFAANPGGSTQFPLVNNSNLARVRKRLDSSGISVANIDVLMLTPGSTAEQFLPALDIGAALDARAAVALVYDNDTERAVHNLGLLCEAARERDLLIAFEFTAFTPLWNNLPGALDLLNTIDQSNLVLGLDILHLVRSGGSTTDVAALSPELIGHAQLCDGVHLDATNNYGEEAAGNRLVPGKGVFPLADFLAALPEDTPLELEVPMPTDVPPADRIQMALAGALEVLREQR